MVLAVVGVASLLALPLLAERSAEVRTFPRPAELPPEPESPAQRDEPLESVEKLDEALQLPRVDKTPTDEHSAASLKAYREGDYEQAFKEAVLAVDPTPLPQNRLYRALTTVDVAALKETVPKPNGRSAVKAVDEALQPVLRTKNSETAAARLNNVAATTILNFYNMDPSEAQQKDQGMAGAAEEMAYQAADLDSSYCPALLNLALLNGVTSDKYRLIGGDVMGLMGRRMVGGQDMTVASTMKYYDPDGCGDPALLYYLAQGSIQWGIVRDKDIMGTLDLLDRLQDEHPEWAGVAHSARGDAYFWFGVLSSGEYAYLLRPFAAQRYFRLALDEYSAALALQPDDSAIHNGMALAYLELGETDEAIREAETALEAAPDAPRPQKTLVYAYEKKGDYATAAQMQRKYLSAEQPLPLALVPYTAISHGADRYSELRLKDASGGGAGGGLMDDDVIRPFERKSYIRRVSDSYRIPADLNQYRDELRHYDLLRYDLLSGDSAALNEDFESAPDSVRQSYSTLLLLGIDRLLSQPAETVTPNPETQAAIEAYFAHFSPGSPYTVNYGDPQLQGNDPFYREAGNFFRQHEQYDNALRVYHAWQAELERDRASAERRGVAENLVGEVHYLNGKPEEALAAFDRAEELVPGWPPYLVRQAFMHEKLGEYERAEGLYRDALDAMWQSATWIQGVGWQVTKTYDYYQAAKHRGDVLLRQAAEPEAEQPQDKYAEAAEAYREALKQPNLSIFQSGAAANNLGIALIETGDYEGAIKVLETLTQPIERLETPLKPPEAFPDWKNLAVPDEHNPVFRLNLGWAYELNGNPDKAAEEYLGAVTSDPTFFPALNDLGVLATKRGDLDEAKGYFKAALDAKEDYAYANHNLGAALLRSGPEDFVAAQGYLARAAREDSSLADTKDNYVFDNELYFLNLSLGSDVPPDWQFAPEARRSAETVSLIAMALLAGRLLLNFFVRRQSGAAVKRFFTNLEPFPLSAGLFRFFVWLRDYFPPLLRLGIPASRKPWITPLAMLLAAPAIVIAQYWSLLWEDSETKLIMLGALLCLTVISLLVHHAGHALAALRSGLWVREAPWPIGITLTLALVAIGGPAFAPLPATDVTSETKEQEREKSFAYLAGPLASTLLAALLYALFWLSHMSLLRFGAVLNLALVATSLMSLPPMEGTSIGEKYYARWLLWLGVFVTAFTVWVTS